MSGRNHLWQGEWIDENELEKRIANLAEWIEPELERGLRFPRSCMLATLWPRSFPWTKLR